MSSENPAPIDAIIADYLRAIDAGNAPDRSALLAKHPEFANELRAFFADLDGVEQAAAPLREIVLAPSPADVETLPPPSNPAEMSTLAPQSASATSPLGVVRYFGDYELLEEIARGGMGVVYKARQVSLNRIVAVKMILAGQLASAADVQRFKTEAEAAANLDHPNILPIYEVGEHEGQHYFSMKLIDGGSLADAIRNKSLTERQAVEFLAKVARAVHYAHQRGILHRDLKPANVLLDKVGTPYVTDFGLAKKVEGDSTLTHTGAILGTPSYMAPEQARSEKVLSTAVDVYSMGAILYEMLCGQPPFKAATAIDTILQVVEKEAADPRLLNPKANRDLSAIALKCLTKEPARRYGSAAEFADDLDRWRNGEPTRARSANVLELVSRWLRRNATAAAAVLTIGLIWGLAVAVGAAVVMSSPYRNETPSSWVVPGGTDLRFWPRSLLHPLGWARLVAASRIMTGAEIIFAIGLTISAGWIACRAVRPRDERSTIATAAFTALIASAAAFFYVSPFVVIRFADFDPRLSLHPIEAPGITHWGSEDPTYLNRFLTSDQLSNQSAPWHLRTQAIDANRLDMGFKALGATAFITMGLFLPAALIGAWVSGYLRRSRGRRWANLSVYLELSVPTTLFAVLLVWCIPITFAIALAIGKDSDVEASTLLVIIYAIMVLQGLVAFLQVRAVVRRWRWWVRLPLALCWIVPIMAPWIVSNFT